MLPEEFAIGLAQAHQNALVERIGLLGYGMAFLRIAVTFVTRFLVIRADINFAAGDRWSAIGSRAKLGHPFDVLPFVLSLPAVHSVRRSLSVTFTMLREGPPPNSGHILAISDIGRSPAARLL